MYTYLNFQIRAACKSRTKYKEIPFGKGAQGHLLVTQDKSGKQQPTLRATLESQHQYCSADISSKIKVWHKKDRPHYSHPGQQIKIFPMFTFIFKTALHSELQSERKVPFSHLDTNSFPRLGKQVFSKCTPNGTMPNKLGLNQSITEC